MRQHPQDRYWGVHALEVVDAIEATRSPAEVESLYRNVIAECGCTAYLMAGLPTFGTTLNKTVLANGWPREWFEIYTRERLVEHDPVPRHCLRTIEPFEFSEVLYDSKVEKQAHSVMMRSLDFGTGKGLCVPIHREDGSTAAVTIAGEQPDFSNSARRAIHLVTLYAHSHLVALLRPPVETNRTLTSREREVLRWAAVGKTSWEIGEILGITERTANAHVASASLKLGTVNKTATVVAALRLREISL